MFYLLLDIAFLYEANAAILWVNLTLKAMCVLVEFEHVLVLSKNVI